MGNLAAKAGADLTSKAWTNLMARRTSGMGLKIILKAAIKEVFEEIVKDGFIEAVAENVVNLVGGTDDLGYWISALGTSAREVGGALGQIILGTTSSKASFKTKITLLAARISGDSQAVRDITDKIESEFKQKQDAAQQKQDEMSTWRKFMNGGTFKGIFMMGTSLFFGGLPFLALTGLSNIVGGTVGISPKVYGEAKARAQAKRKDWLTQEFGTKNLFSGRALEKQMKKPANIDGEALTNLFRNQQETDTNNAPAIDITNLFNPNPKNNLRNNLQTKFADQFNTIAFEGYFNEWVQNDLMKDDRFKSITKDFKEVQNNYKTLGTQKAEAKIIDLIHEALKDNPQQLRWTNMFGVQMFDPVLAFAGFPRGIVDLLKNYDIKENQKSKEDIIKDIQRLTGLTTPLDLIHISGEHIPDGTRNVIQWLEDRDFTIDDKIVVVPKIMYKEGVGIFDRSTWDGTKTSPYHPFFKQFLLDMFSLLRSDSVQMITSGIDLDEISERALSRELSLVLGYSDTYFRDKLNRLSAKGSKADFLPNLISFDRWYLKLKEFIINKFQPTSIGVDHQRSLDQSKLQNEALELLDTLYLKYDKVFGFSKNEYALDLRRAIVKIANYFGEENIKDLKDILDFSAPANYYGIKHPEDRPYDLESVIDHLLINPLKFIISDKLGRPISNQDLKNDASTRLIEIGGYLSINYDSDITIDYSDSLSLVEKAEIDSYIKIIKDNINSISSYWRTNKLLDSYEDSPKKYLISKLFRTVNNFVPYLGRLSIFKISSALYQSLSPQYIYYSLSQAPSEFVGAFVDNIKLQIASMNRIDFSDTLETSLTISEFEYMRGELLNDINSFTINYRKESAQNLGDFLFYKKLNYRDRQLVNNLVENFRMSVILHAGVTKLDQHTIKNTLSEVISVVGSQFDNLILDRTLKDSDFVKITQDLKEIYHTIYGWFVDEFGSRDPGLEKYKKLSLEQYNKYEYYSNTLQSIVEICKQKGIDFTSPSISQISLLEAVKKKVAGVKVNPRELVMNHYDLKYWGKKNVIPFHRFYHLTKYIGFDSLLFMGMDSSNLDKNMGKSRDHHFRGFIFRKMSSHVQDIALTNVVFHGSYETLFDEYGRRQAEAIIVGLQSALEELIWLTDANGNFKDVDEFDVEKALKRNLGSLWKIGRDFWVTKGRGSNTKTISQFRNRDLVEFNRRRKYILASDGKVIPQGFQNFLEREFEDYYKAHFNDARSLFPALFLGTRRDFTFMNFVYIDPIINNNPIFDLSNL